VRVALGQALLRRAAASISRVIFCGAFLLAQVATSLYAQEILFQPSGYDSASRQISKREMTGPLETKSPAVALDDIHSEDASAELAQQATGWIVWLAHHHLPRQYDNTKHWGQQKTVLDGWEFRSEGLKLETKRRWKEVNHGNWTKYQIQIREPKENFQIAISDIKTLANGKVQFAANIKAPLDLQGRLSVWQYDVQVVSLNMDAEADVEVDMICQVAVRLHPLTFPPDILLEPEVVSAEMKLNYFRLNRLSQVGGPLAKRLGEGLEIFLREKVKQEGNDLPRKINRAIEKRRDRLRISGVEWIQSKMKEMFNSQKGE
jgi:hypothetical protein